MTSSPMDAALRGLCLKYAPRISVDDNEPFAITGIGCTVFSEAGKSPSFHGSVDRRRTIDPASRNAEFAIEYAYSFDYDIQHLYELEHIWVYVDSKGKVCGAEGSFHGKFLNLWTKHFPILDNAGKGLDTDSESTHIHVYAQPGKHAFMAAPELFELIPDLIEACGPLAGEAGFDLPQMFEGTVRINGNAADPQDPELNQAVKTYIKNHFAFVPSMTFHQVELDSSLYRTWDSLAEEIPRRLEAELHRIWRDS